MHCSSYQGDVASGPHELPELLGAFPGSKQGCFPRTIPCWQQWSCHLVKSGEGESSAFLPCLGNILRDQALSAAPWDVSSYIPFHWPTLPSPTAFLSSLALKHPDAHRCPPHQASDLSTGLLSNAFCLKATHESEKKNWKNHAGSHCFLSFY